MSDDPPRANTAARRALNVLVAIGVLVFIGFVVGGILLVRHG